MQLLCALSMLFERLACKRHAELLMLIYTSDYACYVLEFHCVVFDF